MPASSPSARQGSLVAAIDQGVLLFGGGLASGSSSSDTWIWNGSVWNAVSTLHLPPMTGDAAGLTSENGMALMVVYASSSTTPSTFRFSAGDWLAA